MSNENDTSDEAFWTWYRSNGRGKIRRLDIWVECRRRAQAEITNLKDLLRRWTLEQTDLQESDYDALMARTKEALK